MNLIEYIGFTAATLSCFSLIPELLQALRTHRLKDVAWGMLGLMFLSSLLWNVYAIANHVTPLFFSSLIHIVLQLSLMSLKLIYERQKKPLLSNEKSLP